MKSKKIFNLIFLFSAIILFSNFFSAYLYSNPSVTQFNLNSLSSAPQAQVCQQGSDFLIQIAPFGCTPSPVRSDLLEQNDVQVYCQLAATQINPLISVSSIDSLTFSGQLPQQVSGIGFQPAQAALGVSGNLNTPVLNNIGYVVINLRQQINESSMPDYVSGNLTAKINYNTNNAFGIGQSLFYLPELNDNVFENTIAQYSFWNGRVALRADSVKTGSADISLYNSQGKFSTVTLNTGQTSNTIFLPGLQCEAGLKLTLQSLDNSDTRAVIRIDAQTTNVAKGDQFLNNKCTVQDLKNYGIMQQITMRCQTDTGANTFSLTISPNISLSIGGQVKSFQLGDKLYTDGSNTVYLGYVGTNGNTGKPEDLYVYLISEPGDKGDNLSESKIASIASSAGSIGAQSRALGDLDAASDLTKKIAGTTSSVLKFLATGEKMATLIVKDNNQPVFNTPVGIVGFTDEPDATLDSAVQTQYSSAVQDYETIKKQYPTETDQAITFGEEAAYNEIILAFDANQKKTLSGLCQDFVKTYPKSTQDLGHYCSNYQLANGEPQSVEVTINKNINKISFDGIYEPTFDDYGVLVTAGTPKGIFPDIKLTKNKAVYLDDSSFLQLVSINDDNSANVIISVVTPSGTSSNTVKMTLNTPIDTFVKGYSFTITKINLKKVAKVSVTSSLDNTGTSTNFSFQISIEKRAIQLSPDEIRSMINGLNNSIKTFSGISNTLGNFTVGLKTACIATGVALIAKNLILNGGSSIARTAVMTGPNGWTAKCADMVSKKTYSSIDNCLSANGDQIDKSVSELANVMNNQNDYFKQVENGITKQQFLGDNVVNTSAEMQDYIPKVASYLKSNNINSALNGPSGQINLNTLLNSVLTVDGYNSHKFTEDQLREIDLYAQVLSDPNASPDLQSLAQQKLYSDLFTVQTAAGNFAQVATTASQLGISSSQISSFSTKEKPKVLPYEGLNDSNNNPIAYVQTLPDGKVYKVVLDNSAGTTNLPIASVNPIASVPNSAVFNPEIVPPVYGKTNLAIYDSSSGYLVTDQDVINEFKQVYFQTTNGYNNQYKNPKLTYYGADQNNLPAIVPFDLAHGWYADVKPTLPSFNGIQSYEANGRVNSFYLCNVGPNGLEEDTNPDDTCEMINTGTGQPYNQFPGLSDSDAAALVTKAIQAIQQASQIPTSQRTGTVTINGNKVPVGPPATNVPQFQCQDFMSPSDCTLLFNLCDPVICPSSRCNLGGTYPVPDVVQTGIIGSIALCMPNFVGFGGTDYIPVCLTGVVEGLNNLISVQQDFRDCLQESLNTGKTVGICNAAFSIYLCDFFWKEALPITNLVIPSVLEAITGQNVKGGGEYLSIPSAWENMQNSINYLTNYYGANSYKSFVTRTTQNVGTDVCKSAISGILPNGGNLLSSLTALDSPPQFGGTFEEIPMTSATSPPTSQYNVFYHIYAGHDSGVSYQVYLKGDPTSSYYKDTSQNLMVASGYVPVGQSFSDTKNPIGVSGYKQMCIDVNGQPECGFQEASTDFALNYIKDQYLASQATQTGITTQSDCISGTASLYSLLLNINAEAAAQSIANPAIYNQGIIRVCATADPGQGTDPNTGTSNARWREVGYCDTPSMKCWIDTQSIENVIKSTTILNQTLDNLSNSYMNILSNQNGFLTTEQFNSQVQAIKNEPSAANKITLINSIFSQAFFSNQKAQLLLLRGNAYSDLFRSISATLPKPSAAPISPGSINPNAPTEGLIGGPPVTGTPSTTQANILQMSDTGPRMVATANLLQGTIVPGKTSNGVTYNQDCWTSMIYAYDFAGVSPYQTGSCGYADVSGTSYTFKNDHTNGNTVTVKIGETINSQTGKLVAQGINSGVCTLDSKASTDNKLDAIQPGYLLSMLWDGQWAHNAIFLGWTDKTNHIADLFDWNDGIIEQGGANANGNVCSQIDLMRDNTGYLTDKNGRDYCKTYRIWHGVNLNDNVNPVFAYWAPHIVSGSAPAPTAPTQSSVPPSVTDTTANVLTQTSQTSTTSTMGDKILQAASKIANDCIGSYSSDCSGIAATFVSRALVNAGVNGVDISKTISSTTVPATAAYTLASLISQDSDFSEVDITNLQNGDVVLLGNGCTEPASIGIVSGSGSTVNVYTTLGTQFVNIPSLTSAIINDNYIYKAYRYTADLATKPSLSRTKWTLDSAITRVSSLTGTYRDNQVFVDQLIFDGVLTAQDCNDVRTYGILGTGQKDMSWLKDLLLAKKANSASSGTLPSSQYTSYQSLFEEYSQQNFPTMQSNPITLNQFKAFLIAIAQQNNWGASTRGGSDWLMGYSSGDVTYQGAEKQIKTVSGIFKDVLEETISSTSPYSPCISTTVLTNKLHCIASVYYTGDTDSIFNFAGKNYADSVMNLWNTWTNYFNSQGVTSGSAH